MKILVMKFRHIGDVLLSAVLAKNLKEAYPDAIVDYLVNAESKDMLTLNPNIDEVFVYDRKKAKSSGVFGRLKYELSLYADVRKRGYDIVINTTEGERGGYAALVSGAKVRVGVAAKKGIFAKFCPYTHPYKLVSRHLVDANLDALRAFGLEPRHKEVELFFAPSDLQKVDELLGGAKEFVHVHPASRWFFKCLSPAQNAEIIDFVESLGVKVVITAAPDNKELKMVGDILSLCKSTPLNLAGKLTLKQLAALSKKAKLFFGADTAAMHIAASQNTPCVAVFGPSGVFNWGAWDNDAKECTYTARNGVQRMGKHTMFQVEWSCAPCGRDGCDGSKKSKCLLEYPLEAVKEEIRARLRA
ncbi:MAG: putative lipopolysaccharide heptosyltransferase III [Campylobacterales bacterium]